MIVNADQIDFEAVAERAKVWTDEANAFFASTADVPALERAREAQTCAFFFEPGFTASEASRRAMLRQVMEKMVGPTPECELRFGFVGSIWFDVEVDDADKESKRALRVMLVPPGVRRPHWRADDVQFVVSIDCLERMYA